jgi:hypothetical protein
MELTLPKPPRETANPAPPRPRGSVRRTTSIDVTWPDGPAADRVLHGVARDLVTPPDGGEGTVHAAATMEAVLRPDRTIAEISAEPEPPGLQELVGAKGGGHLRLLMQEVLPGLIAEAHPLYLLLDDISGTSLVCSWAWSLWNPDWLAAMRESMGGDMAKMMEERAGVCWGLQKGHSGLDPDRPAMQDEAAAAGDLRNPADPGGWHRFPALEGVTMRRARRVDVWRDAGTGRIEIDSAFQDSAPRPDGSRAALHEYRLRASAHPESLELLSIEPEARVLPFHECPGAIPNARALVGSSLPAIRETVLSDLRGPRGCTHLNDALRALADVPRLIEALDDTAQ